MKTLPIDIDAQSKEVLEVHGFKVSHNLPFCLDSGIEFWIGVKGRMAAISSLMHNADLYMITKEDARAMSYTASIEGIDKVELFTNYGIELHSKHEKPKDIGFSKITKIIQP